MFNFHIQENLHFLENFHILDFYMNFYTFLYQAFHILEIFHILENILNMPYFRTLSKLQYASLIGWKNKYIIKYKIFTLAYFINSC